MSGARQHHEPAPAGAPDHDVVHSVHDRYLVEVVEQLGLCPFARRSREQGRVHRPLVYDDPPRAASVAERLRDLLAQHPDAEIVLFTFVHRDPVWPRARAFDDFVKQVRAVYDAFAAPTFFMVGFHPRSGEPDPGDTPPKLTADSLVPVLRRTPDPVIQCVHADVLERARAQAQQAAFAKMLAEVQKLDPRLVPLLERSIQPDSTLSADIAKKNFEQVAHGEGRARLEEVIADVGRERVRAYSPWWPPATPARDDPPR